ncbi:MAG TPA: YceI family protein, partial [Candidatus Thermoplasmatota archaeon]|nr:YceI family protein [Candidatus Thermoplasmatota archaeon]
TVTGRFTGYKGTLVYDEKDPTNSTVVVDIEAKTIDTGAPDRDTHLRSPDFFDVEKYPTLRFESTRVALDGDEEGTVHGNLTIHGVTQPVALKTTLEGRAKDPWGKERIAFTAETTINRKDFGLNWNVALEAGGVLVSEKVKIALHLAFVKE